MLYHYYYYLLLLLLLLLATAAVGRASGNKETNCTERYETALEGALNIKRECGNLEFKDCCEAYTAAQLMQPIVEAGEYIIDDVCKHRETFQEKATVRARCNSGWLVILRRNNTIPSSDYVDFARDWTDYVDGFGDLSTEFWYGLRNMHCLTTSEGVDLRIIFKKSSGTEEMYVYHTFRVGGAHTNYRLTIGGFQTPAPGSDRMTWHNGAAFSTRDADHDTWGLNCAAYSSQGAGGGWWYKNCAYAFFTTPHSSGVKIRWASNNYADAVEMQVRPKRCAN